LPRFHVFESNKPLARALATEDAYYEAQSGWQVLASSERLLAAGRWLFNSRINAPAGSRTIAAIGALVLLYCVSVPLAPVLLFRLA
jgi:hypothetical protein